MRIHRRIFSPIGVNTYIVDDGTGNCAIIDCGCYDKSEFGELQMTLNELKLKPVLLLNTHMHIDHIFGNRFVYNEWGLKTLCDKEEETNRLNAPQHATLFGLEMEEAPEPGGWLSNGQVVTFGNASLGVISVPGHTAGGVAFYSEGDSVLFSGDTLFQGSIGRTDLPGGDYDRLMKSIKDKLLVLPPETIVYPGHGEESTIGTEAATNPFLV